MSRAVADATVLIYLAKLGELHLLGELFDDVFVPEPVHREVVERGRQEGYPDALAVDDATGDQFQVRTLTAETTDRATAIRETANLGAGEASALALAATIDARCLTDDHAARQTAETLDIPVGGTIYVLLQALDAGQYSLEEYVTLLDALDDAGFRMSASLYQQAIDAGENILQE